MREAWRGVLRPGGGASSGAGRSARAKQAGTHIVELQVGDGLTGVALGPEIAGAGFALPTLGGHTEFELDIVKAVARAGRFGDGVVADAVANANNHGKDPGMGSCCA